MTIELKTDKPISSGGPEFLFQGDFERVKNEVDQILWPNLPAQRRTVRTHTISQTESDASATRPNTQENGRWVPIEMEEGVQWFDRTKFTPSQEAYYQATQHMSAGEWQSAIEAFRRLIALGPAPALLRGAYIMLGTTYFQSGDLARAAQTFEEVVNLGGHVDFAYLFWGTTLMLDHKYQEAINPLIKALELSPSGTHVRFYLGYVYEQLGRQDEALAYYEAEVANVGGSKEVYEHLGKAHFRIAEAHVEERERHYLAAIDAFKAWAVLEEHKSPIHNFIGYMYSQIGDVQAATIAFKASVELDPNNVIALSNLGLAYLNAERNEEAMKVFAGLTSMSEAAIQRSLANGSDNPEEEARLCLAEAYQLLGASCLKLYQSATSEDKETLESRLLLKAEEAFEKALGYNPEDMHSLYNLAVVYFMQKRYAAAESRFERVIELDPHNPDAPLNLQIVKTELERLRSWLEVTVGRKLQGASVDSPVTVEDLLNTTIGALDKIFQSTSPEHWEDVFAPHHTLTALSPVAQQMEPPEARLMFAANAFAWGLLPPHLAAELAGVNENDLIAALGREKPESAIDAERHKPTVSSPEVEAAVALLQSWHYEDPEEQKETWEFLRHALDEDRLSDRKLFQ